MTDHGTLDIRLMGREYRVVCPPEERDALVAAASLLEGKMKEIAGATKSTGERLAVMAALNIAHQLLARKGSSATFDDGDLKRRIAAMETRLDAALAGQDDLF